MIFRRRGMYILRAVSRLRPAGPPPTQTTSYISAVFAETVAKVRILWRRSSLMHLKHVKDRGCEIFTSWLMAYGIFIRFVKGPTMKDPGAESPIVALCAVT